MKSKFIFVIVSILICLGLFFITSEVLKLSGITASIVTSLTYGVIVNILYRKVKFK